MKKITISNWKSDLTIKWTVYACFVMIGFYAVTFLYSIGLGIYNYENEGFADILAGASWILFLFITPYVLPVSIPTIIIINALCIWKEKEINLLKIISSISLVLITYSFLYIFSLALFETFH
ncbi:MAG: hypothetical protein ACTSXQ_00330 [Alphaproteobacteria bacterium]